MPIPQLFTNYLPLGLHDCTLQELKKSFGNNSRRRELTDKLEKYIGKVKKAGISGWLIINGSFVTSKNNPIDIDVVLITKGNYPPPRPITSEEYEIISPRVAREQFELHLFVRINANPNSNDMITFFSGVREDPKTRKGLLRITI